MPSAYKKIHSTANNLGKNICKLNEKAFNTKNFVANKHIYFQTFHEMHLAFDAYIDVKAIIVKL